MITVKKYSPEYKLHWDELVKKSKNGTFLFYRDFMDYHSERFRDQSFLIYYKDKLEGVLPGNISNDIFYSHQGLTYGGIVLSQKSGIKEVLEIFRLVNEELSRIGVKEVIYKPVPNIYHSYPSQEDIYALFLMKAMKIGCHISSAIFQNNKIRFTQGRRSGITRSQNANVVFEESDKFELFWDLLSDNLSKRFHKSPVHSLAEIKVLKTRFPENIKLYIARYSEEVVAGCVIFVTRNTVHVQYITASEKGKELCALDLVFDYLINKTYSSVPVFDFGHSTEKMGEYLNENLIFQKEGFGGRGIVYETYKYNIG
jgi:hypothetical protein